MELRYPLSLQTVLPDDYETNAGFGSLLERVRGLGLRGVELNMSDPRRFDPGAVCAFLGRFGLELSMLATGLTARKLGLSLSHPDDSVRSESVEICNRMVDWVAGTPAGLIIGFLKGGVAADPPEARARFSRSLAEILPRAVERSVAVLVEATNRYESSVANTVGQTVSLLSDYPASSAQVLPDTFHMNIEETSMRGALRAAAGRFSSIHLSDNNRLFPGLGAIDFSAVIGLLAEIGYTGRVAIEGNVRDGVEEDLRASMERMAPIMRG
jgi:sugar phosphate isomerase/epimerase